MDAQAGPHSDVGLGGPASLAGDSCLRLVIWRSAAVLAMLSVTAGAWWRVVGEAPPLGAVLDVCGLALWALALWLAPAWEQQLRRQDRHFVRRSHPWRVRGANALRFAASTAAVSVAPLGLLLAFDGAAAIATVHTPDPTDFTVQLLPLVLYCLLIAGPTLLLASCALLLAARRWLGSTWGAVAWLAGTATIHLPLISGTEPGPVPTTLGGLALRATELLAAAERELTYANELVYWLIGVPLAVLAVMVGLTVLAQAAQRRRGGQLNGAWLATLAGLGLVALRSLTLTHAWAADAGLRYPGGWLQLFTLGLLSVWLIRWLDAWSDGAQQVPLSFRRDILWLWFGVGGWTCLTLPHRLADQASREEILLGAWVGLVLATCGVVLIHYLGRWRGRARAAWGIALVLMLTLLVIPLGHTTPPAAVALFWELVAALGDPLRAPSAYYVLGSLAVACVLLWPWPWHRRRLSRA